MAVTYVHTPSTTIESAKVNTNMTDLASGTGITKFGGEPNSANNKHRGFLQSDEATVGWKHKMNSDGNLVISDDTAIREIIVPVNGDLKAAVDAIPSRGIVTAMPGIHTITATLAMDMGKAILRGTGLGATTILCSGVSNRAINVVSDHITIRDLQIDCNGLAIVGIRVTTDGDFARIQDCLVEDYSTSIGIQVGVDATARGVSVLNCEVNGVTSAQGILVDYAERCRIIGNYVDGNTDNDIELTANSTYTTCVGNVVSEIIPDNGTGNEVSLNALFP